MYLKEILMVIASVMAFFGNISYLKAVFAEKVKPHPYTWFIWSIVSLVTFFGQLQKGAGIAVIPAGVAEVFTIMIFIFSLKYFFQGKINYVRKIDHFFLAFALLGLIPWAITDDPTISVVIVVLIDVIAFVPAIRKTYLNPSTEKSFLYEMNVARHSIILSILGAYNIATTFHSIAMIITNTIMFCVIRFKKNKNV